MLCQMFKKMGLLVFENLICTFSHFHANFSLKVSKKISGLAVT